MFGDRAPEVLRNATLLGQSPTTKHVVHMADVILADAMLV